MFATNIGKKVTMSRAHDNKVGAGFGSSAFSHSSTLNSGGIRDYLNNDGSDEMTPVESEEDAPSSNSEKMEVYREGIRNDVNAL